MLQDYSVTFGCFNEKSLNENLLKRGTSKYINFYIYDNPVPTFCTLIYILSLKWKNCKQVQKNRSNDYPDRE